MADALHIVHLGRARQFADGMKFFQEELGAYASAAGLLAVHSAISYSDAVLIGLSGRRSRSENHQEAVRALRRACGKANVDRDGILHFQRLVSVKTDISYGDRQIDNERIAALCIAAERFQVWAERILQRRKEG